MNECGYGVLRKVKKKNRFEKGLFAFSLCKFDTHVLLAHIWTIIECFGVCALASWMNSRP